jgi:hypothetical protein
VVNIGSLLHETKEADNCENHCCDQEREPNDAKVLKFPGSTPSAVFVNVPIRVNEPSLIINVPSLAFGAFVNTRTIIDERGCCALKTLSFVLNVAKITTCLTWETSQIVGVGARACRTIRVAFVFVNEFSATSSVTSDTAFRCVSAKGARRFTFCANSVHTHET